MSSKNQFFLVIDKIEQCRWNFFGKQREEDICPGHVVVIRPCNDGKEFEVHRGSRTWAGPLLVTREGGLPQDKVISITDQEFDVLLGVYYGGDGLRREFHSSGRLKWACQLKAGDEVQVKLGHHESIVAGVFRGSGTLRAGVIDYGLQFIVEITVKSQLVSEYKLRVKFPSLELAV